ncbi:MAG TPA: DUF3488 and transglutaminase-like domain-containing protein [Phycisphaerales bacterium]|nr:DUF3488 and transglutaminase-like domain-containing protein [Phycisphaerales bacterium]
MRLIRSFPFFAFMLVMLSLVTVSLAQRDMMWLLMTATLAVLSWYVTESRWQLALPHWVSNILVIGASLNVLRDLAQHDGDVLGALGRFAVLLTLIKLYERKSARDYAQLLSLTLLLMLVATFRSIDLLNGVLLLVYTALGMYVAMTFQLYTSFERARNIRLTGNPAAQRLLPPVKPIFGRHPMLHLRTMTAALAVCGLLISAFVFLAFPRGLGAEFLGRVNVGRTEQISGFSPRLALQSFSHISTSQMRVMTVQFLGADGRPIHFQSPVYIRGAVLDQYRWRGQWIETDHHSVRISINPPPNSAPVSLGNVPITPTQPVKEIIDTRFATDNLFSVATAVSIAAPESNVDEPEVDYYPATGVIETPRSDANPRTYEIIADLAPSEETRHSLIAGTPVSDWRNRDFIDDNDHSVTKLEESILEPIGEQPGGEQEWAYNLSAAKLIENYLHSSKFSYSLDTSDIVVDSGNGHIIDPVVPFLLRTHRGHCEFFAAGMTALCHCAGVEARIVIGFLGYNYDESAQHYNILQSNAHAWVEVRTGPNTWTMFDPTPPAAIPLYHRANANLLSQLNWTYNDLQQNWTHSVVQFDSGAQASLTNRLQLGWSDRLAGMVKSVQDWMASVNHFFNVGPGGYIWMGIVALCIVLAVVALITLMRRTRDIDRRGSLQHVHGAEYQRMLRLLGFYVDALHALDEAKLSKPMWQPPLQYSRRLARSHPTAAEILADLSRTFYAVRFGGHRPGMRERKAIRAKVESLTVALQTLEHRSK